LEKKGNKERITQINDISINTQNYNIKFNEVFDYRHWIIQFLKKEYTKKDNKV